MIELIQSPDKYRVIADGNDTEIILQANQDPGYFIRANIYINDAAEPFLVQAWSKDENGICDFNLKHLYHAYFTNNFSPSYTTGLHAKLGLLKKVKIVVKEYKIGENVSGSTLTLPEFYIIKNRKPILFNDEEVIQFLGLPQQKIKVDRSTGFVFPLYLKAGDSLKVSVHNTLNEEIFSQTIENYPLQLAQYELDFDDLEIAGMDYIFVRFTTDSAVIQRQLVFEDSSLYPPKTIFYLNNYGFFISACLYGRKEDLHSLTPKSYAQQDGTEVTYDVEDTRELELSSGYGYKNITDLIHAIATSVDVRMQLDGFWERVKSETKKITRLIDNKYIYGEALSFSRLNVPSFTNENTYAMIPEINSLLVVGDENQIIEISKAAFISIYSAIQPATILQIREVPVNGKLSYVDNSGVVALSDLIANDPILLPHNISLDTFVKLIYEPDQRLSGDPLDQIDFKMGTEVILSNTAQISFCVNDIPDTDLPPEIILNTIKYVALDANNNATGTIDATVNVAAGHSLQINWTVLNAAPISFNDATLEDPTISLTNAQANTTYQIKITATDIENGLSSEKIINISTSSFGVKIEKITYPEEYKSKKVDFRIYGGQPGGEITLRFTVLMYLIVMGGARYVLYNYNLPEEEIKYSGSEDIVITLDANGEKTIPCQIINGSSSEVTLKAEIINAASPQIIDPVNYIVTEAFTGPDLF